MRVVSMEGGMGKEGGLALSQAALEGQEDQVGAAADAKLAEQIGDVKFYGALGNVQTAANFFVGKIFEEGIENFLFAAAQIGDGVGFEAATLASKYGVHETGKELAGNPEAT